MYEPAELASETGKNDCRLGTVESPESTQPGIVLIVDGSNVAYGNDCEPSAERLRHFIDYIGKFAPDIVTIVDATLRHRVKDKADIKDMFEDGAVVQAPAGRSADEFIVALTKILFGRGERVLVLTNDLGLAKRLRGFGERVGYMIAKVAGKEILLFDDHMPASFFRNNPEDKSTSGTVDATMSPVGWFR